MVRGHAKQVAQEKNAKKQQALLKQKNRDNGDDKKTKKAVVCKVCFVSMIGEKALREHYAGKHDRIPFNPKDYGLS